MRIAGRHATSLVDGKGVNYTLFVQGCEHGCKGCQNPSTWDMAGGTEMPLEQIEDDIESFVPPVSGVTFSGGDPIYQIDDTIALAVWAKKKGLRTTLYTGFDIEDLMQIFIGAGINEGNSPFDYIVDGCFEMAQKSNDCAFRGSKNQSIYKKVRSHYKKIDIDDDGVEVSVD